MGYFHWLWSGMLLASEQRPLLDFSITLRTTSQNVNIIKLRSSTLVSLDIHWGDLEASEKRIINLLQSRYRSRPKCCLPLGDRFYSLLFSIVETDKLWTWKKSKGYLSRTHTAIWLIIMTRGRVEEMEGLGILGSDSGESSRQAS